MATQIPSDYKALVYLFLYGGNQSYNTIVPYTQAKYDEYARTRGVLALPRVDATPPSSSFSGFYPTTMPGLIALNGTAPDGYQYGMHPECTGLASLFNSGKVAVIANIGPLVQPTTLKQYFSAAPLPAQLFSHYDQTEQWMIGTAGSTMGYGWGGKIADTYKTLGYTPELDVNMHPLTQNTFGSGTITNSYSVGVGAPPASYTSRYENFYISGARSDISAALKSMALVDANPMVKGYAEIKDSFRAKSNVLGRVIAGTGNILKSSSAWTTTALFGSSTYGKDTGVNGYGAQTDGYPDYENSRIVAVDPFGSNTVVWQITSLIRPTATSVTANTANIPRYYGTSDGGFNTTETPADNTKKYRYSAWIKRTGDPDSFTVTGSIVSGTKSVLIVDSIPAGKVIMERQRVFVGTTYVGEIAAYSAMSTSNYPDGITPSSLNFCFASAVGTSYPAGTTITIKSTGGAFHFGPGPGGDASLVTNLSNSQAMWPYWWSEHLYNPVSSSYPSGYSIPKDKWLLLSFSQYPASFTLKSKGTVAALSNLPTSGASVGDYYTIGGTAWIYVNAPTTSDDATTLANNYYSYRGFTKNGIDPEDGIYARKADGTKEKIAGPGVTLKSTTLNGTITNSVQTIKVTDITKFFTTGGLAKIENEVISYTGVDLVNNNLTGCQRGLNNSGAASHNSGVAISTLYEVYYPASYSFKSSLGTSVAQLRVYNFYGQEGTLNVETTITLSNVNFTNSTGTITYTSSTPLTAGAFVTLANLSGVTITGYTDPTKYKVSSVISSTSVVLTKVDGTAISVTATGAASGTITAVNPNEYFNKYLVSRPRLDKVDGAEPSIDALVLTGGSTNTEITTSFDGSDGYGSIGPQLSQVFDIIRSSSSLTVGTLQDKRQLFFVNMYGFDNHDDEGLYHPALMQKLSRNVKAFYDALTAAGIADKVTVTIQSEFARTLAPNGYGDGSDHAWGGYALVVGDAVKGYSSSAGRSGFYGTPPSIALGSGNPTTVTSVTLTNFNITDTIGTFTYSSPNAYLKTNDRVTITQTNAGNTGAGSITGHTNPTTYKVLSSGNVVRLVTLDGAAVTTTAGTIAGTITALNPNVLDVDGAGRLIPTTAVEQHAATLATWLGIDAADLTTIFPNLNNFTPTNLGFMV